jgi:cell division protein FtsL
MTPRRLKRDRRWALIKFCFFTYVFIAIFAIISLRIGVVNLEYRLGDLENKKAELIRQSRLLSAKRASLFSVKEIEEMAREQLGMRFPEREKIFIVKKVKSPAPYRASGRLLSTIEGESPHQ